MATKSFQDYFISKPLLAGEYPVEGDQLLVIRGGDVFRADFILNRAYMSMSGNAVVTPITVTNQWEEIGGVFVVGLTTSTFSFAANALTYNGPTQSAISDLTARATLLKTGAPMQSYEIGIFVNGGLSGLPVAISLGNSETHYVATAIQLALTNGDVIDLRVRATSGTDDVTVIDSVVTSR